MTAPAPEPETATSLLVGYLTQPEIQADPYPLYRRLHAFGPAVSGPNGVLVLTGYRPVAAATRDHRLLKQPEPMLVGAGHPDWRARPALRLMFTSLLVRNPPTHTRLRRLVSGAFTARRVAGLRPAIERIVAAALDRLSGQTCFVTEFALPVPVAVIGELLGVPEADRPMLQPLVHDWTRVLGEFDEPTVARADQAAVAISDYFVDLAAQRRQHPGDDLISALVAPADGAPGLSGEELVTMAALLLGAGFETTTGLLANGLVALLDHPDQAARLRAEPKLAEPAVEELLRFDSPVQFLSTRTPTEDIEVAGQPLPAGQRAMMLLGAANRDPAVFEAPDELRLDRAGEPPLSFGGGLHYCLGAPLARLEAQLAFPALLRAFPRLRVAGPGERSVGLVLHGYHRLPVLA